MDEHREEREELAAVDREATDTLREQTAEREYWQERPREGMEAVTDAKPYPKAQQLARGAKRYRRKVASPKQWQAISAAKIGPCRVCLDPTTNGRIYGRIELHHVVPRDLGGDDVEDNIVPLCRLCHHAVTVFRPAESHKLCASLTDAEYAYAVQKCGESVFARCYGITYAR